MQRAFLGAGVLRDAHRIDGAADDARLDLRAGVDADGGNRVIHRVEVVVLRRGVDRVGAAARPQRDALEFLEVEPLPRLQVFRMRADQDPGLADPWIGRSTDGADPVGDELRLVRRDELRRAEIEEERLVRREAGLAAELLARRAGTPLEPLVVDRRAGDADVLRLHAVHRDRFALLRFVPDEDAIRQHANQALVRQVVPAVHAQRAANAERTRGLRVLHLIGAKVDERRNQHDVRVLRGDDIADPAIAPGGLARSSATARRPRTRRPASGISGDGRTSGAASGAATPHGRAAPSRPCTRASGSGRSRS